MTYIDIGIEDPWNDTQEEIGHKNRAILIGMAFAVIFVAWPLLSLLW